MAGALFVGWALYVPAKACRQGQRCQNKLQLAARLVAEWPVVSVLIAVAEGALAKKPFVPALKADGRFVLSRLRKEAVF